MLQDRDRRAECRPSRVNAELPVLGRTSTLFRLLSETLLRVPEGSQCRARLQPSCPGGMLNRTFSRPVSRSLTAMASGSKSYGNRYSTPVKPASLAASKRSRNGTSVNTIDRLAANLGMLHFLCLLFAVVV